MFSSSARALRFAGLFGLSAVVSNAFHPADSDTDWRISLTELTAYGQAWTGGTSWATGPSPITDNFYRQAEFIWKQGERYRELTEAPAPQGWIPDPQDGTLFLAPAEMNAEPLDLVSLIGLPEGQTNLFAEFRAIGEIDRKITFLVPLEEDQYAVVMPFFPQQAGGVNAFELIVFSDEGEYPVGPVLLQPLPPAPGTGSAASSALQSASDDLGLLLNTDLEGLVDIPLSEIPDDLKIPAMVDQVIRDPNNPNNLSRLLDGTAPLLDELDVDPAMLDSLLAKLGVLEQVETFQADVRAALRQRVEAERTGYMNLETDSLVLNYSTLSELAEGMQTQCEAAVKADMGPNETALRDQAAVVASGVAIAGGPVGAAAAASFNTTLWALDTYTSAKANQYPSDVTDFNIELSPGSFLEDKCEQGSWKATLTATSNGWSLDKTAISGALNVVGAAGAAGAGAKASEAARKGLTAGENLAVDVSLETGVFAFGKAFPDEGGVINVPPSTWSGIQVTASDLSLLDISYEGVSVKAVGEPSFIYEPNEEAGETILRITTKAGVLGTCGGSQGNAMRINVKENQVSLSPLGGEIEPEEQRKFTSTVKDAEDKRVEFSVSHGTILKQEQLAGTETYELTYKAPSEEEMPDQITITATSLADQCLRANVTRDRSTTLQPKKNNFVLDPNVSCVQIGATVNFEVINTEGGEVPSVSWEKTGVGTFSPSGTKATYTATQQGGPVIVRATVQAEEPVVLEQTFEVGECIAIALTFQIPQSTGSFSYGQGIFSITDVPAANNGDPDAFEQYKVAVSGEVTSLDGGRVAGSLRGNAINLRFPNGIDFEDGSETYKTTAFNFNYELTVISRVGFDDLDPEVPAVSIVAPGRLQVNFASNATLNGNWPGGVSPLTNWTWQFSDGTTLVGERVSHTFNIGAPYDKWVILTVANAIGQTASYKQHLRFVDFNVDFSGPYDPAGSGSCFTGFGGSCPGEITLVGPHNGSLRPGIFSSYPNPSEPGTHIISINY